MKNNTKNELINTMIVSFAAGLILGLTSAIIIKVIIPFYFYIFKNASIDSKFNLIYIVPLSFIFGTLGALLNSVIINKRKK